MKRNRKLLALTLSALMTAGLLAGCSAASSSTTETDVATSAAGTTAETANPGGEDGVFTICNAILPAAFSQIVAWAGMRLETNFSECAILGMVGAGGIGYVISNSLQGYDYGTAGVAILLVFAVAYAIERLFVRIKRKFNQ